MNFGFVLFQGAEELDFVGPWEVINVWSKIYKGPEKVFTVSQHAGLVHCANHLRILPDYTFQNSPRLDYLLVPGGEATDIEQKNAEMLSFVKTQAVNCKHILSVCTGSFILQAAGLLQGKSATTYWHSIPRLRETGVNVLEQRFVRDGKIWTAAGVSAGIDLALAFIADQAGEDITGKVQLAVEYYPGLRKYGTAHQSPGIPNYLRENNG